MVGQSEGITRAYQATAAGVRVTSKVVATVDAMKCLGAGDSKAWRGR
jgi:hypothetical protein